MQQQQQQQQTKELQQQQRDGIVINSPANVIVKIKNMIRNRSSGWRQTNSDSNGGKPRWESS
jgi:hypothetical protein